MWLKITIAAVTGIGAVMLSVSSIIDQIKNNRKEKLEEQKKIQEEHIRLVEATTGYLKGSKIPTYTIGFVGGLVTEKPKISKYLEYLENGNGPLIILKPSNGDFLISMQIRDQRGNLIAGIQDNYWTVYNKEYDYNNDDSTFEIVTPVDNKVLFQIFFRNGVAYIGGLVVDDEGNGNYYTWNGNNNSESHRARSSENVFQMWAPLFPAFEYPRRENLGRRAFNDGRRDLPIPMNIE